MKQSYNIEVAGLKLNIVTSDGAEFVEETVKQINNGVDTMLRVGKNYSKLDALALLALDYCGEFHKAEAKIKNLEAQIEILEANIKRLRGGADEEISAKEEAVEAAPAEKAVKADKAEKKAKAEKAEAKEEKPAKEDAAEDSSRDAKFRQLEALLGSQLKMDIGDK